MSELSDTEPRHCGIREPARHGCWRVEVVCDNGMDRRQQKRRGPAGDALPGPCTASHRMTPIDCRVAIITDPATTHCREGGIHYYTDEETFARPNDPWTRICKKTGRSPAWQILFLPYFPRRQTKQLIKNVESS